MSALKKAWLITANSPAEIYSSYASMNCENDLIIAVDKGLERLHELNILPTLIIGDMDSVDPVLLAQYASVEMDIHSADKDETDTELAILWCLRHQVREIVICNDLGGRFDHALALVQNLAFSYDNGLKGSIESSDQKVFLLDSETHLEGCAGCLLSLLSLEGEVCIGTSEGLQYSLNGLVLTALRPRGISNRITAQDAWIKLASGKVIAIITK